MSRVRTTERAPTRSGYVRLIPQQHPFAVRWWVVIDFGDGFVYAAGDRCRTARQARKRIRDLGGWPHGQAYREHQAYLQRPRFELGPEGELVPLNADVRRVHAG